MKCSHCHRTITPTDERKAVIERDAKGRVVGAIHYKCQGVLNKRARMGGKRWREQSPTAYAEALSRRTRDDLSAEQQERLAQAEARYAALRERVKQGVATGEEKTELGALSVARDGRPLDFEALANEGAEAKAREAQAALAEQRAKEAAPQRWDDYRDPSNIEV